MTEIIPVEIRLWMPDGTKIRIRARLDELKVDRDYVPVQSWREQVPVYLVGAQDYHLRAHGPAWTKDRNGKPVLGPEEKRT